MMTDFVKFKDAMLENKRAFKWKKDNRESGWIDLIKTGGWKFYERFKNEDPSDPASGWNKVITWTSKNGNLEGTVYGKKVDDFRTDWQKVVIHYKDITLADWTRLQSDWEGLLKDDPQNKEVKVVERHPNGNVKVNYLRVGLGMFMTDRDCLIETNQVRHANGSWFQHMISTQHPDYPENNKSIRVNFFAVNDWVASADGKGSVVTEHTNSDGLGWIPPSLMNMTMGTTTK